MKSKNKMNISSLIHTGDRQYLEEKEDNMPLFLRIICSLISDNQPIEEKEHGCSVRMINIRESDDVVNHHLKKSD
jgi:hypothetical protein